MKGFRNILLFPLLASCSAVEQQKPNFIVILVDDLGWADVNCNNPGTFYETPNIDRMAETGVRFAQAYSAHPVSSPTRAAIMTGKHPNRVGITDWIPGDRQTKRPFLGPKINNELALEEFTLAEKLKEKGYKTCFIGKWHLGGEGFYPEDQGFDINIGGMDKGSPPGGYYSPYNNPKLKDGPDGEYLTDRLTNESISFIEENLKEPFLLYLSFYTVHTPIQASEKHVEKFRQKRNMMGLWDDINQTESRQGSPVPHNDTDQRFYRTEGEGWTKLFQDNANYASMVAAMDENVGRLMGALQKAGLDNNTWVFFTSDNGGLSTLYAKGAPTSNDKLRAGKGWCYEGGIRVPFIIKGPGIKNPGRAVNQPVVSMDIFPTLLSLAGVKHDKNDGENLIPVLKEDKQIPRDELFWHYPHYHGSAWKPGSALRKGDWKLVIHYEDNRTELFNLGEDPGETTDLTDKFPEKTEELKKLLNEKLAETGAKFPNRIP